MTKVTSWYNLNLPSGSLVSFITKYLQSLLVPKHWYSLWCIASNSKYFCIIGTPACSACIIAPKRPWLYPVELSNSLTALGCASGSCWAPGSSSLLFSSSFFYLLMYCCCWFPHCQNLELNTRCILIYDIHEGVNGILKRSNNKSIELSQFLSPWWL